MTNETRVDSDVPQLPVNSREIHDAAISELDRLTELVEHVPQDSWSKASAAAGWNVGDVVAHLNLALGLYTRLLSVALKGGGSSGVWKAFGQATKKLAPVASPAFNAVNNAMPRLVSSVAAPEVVRGQFQAAARKYRERLDEIGPTDYMRPIQYMGGPWPLSFFLAATVNEMAVHGWDIASRLSGDAHLGPGARAVLPSFYWGASGYMFHPPEGLNGAVQASLRDDTTELWWTLANGSEHHGAGTALHHDALITGESGTFVLVLSGRIRAEEALSSTSLTVEGNEALARGFLSAWRIT